MIGFVTSLTGRSQYLGQKPMVGEYIGSSREPITVVLLNEHVNMPPKCLYLY